LKINKALVLNPLTLIFFITSCAEYSSVFNTKTALGLETGDCYIELQVMDLIPGEVVELGGVEVVSCLTPHSHEVISKYSSLPLSYRSNYLPLDDLCLDASMTYIKSLHPHANDYQMERILQKFDHSFTYMYYFNYSEANLNVPDYDSEISCSIMSKASLRIGPFKKVIADY